VRFWDANAIVPLLVRELRTEECRRFLREDEEIVVWWATRSECISALARKTREGILEPLQYAQARVRLHHLREAWAEVQPTVRVRALAETLLLRYPLRTADAYQLSAAVHWRENLPQGAFFVCYDERLKDAAAGEGFTVLPY
jgi:predicted nucleic acid-binding protein